MAISQDGFWRAFANRDQVRVLYDGPLPEEPFTTAALSEQPRSGHLSEVSALDQYEIPPLGLETRDTFAVRHVFRN